MGKANGILGMAPRPQGHTVIQALFADTKHVEGRVLSMCLAEWGGLLSVGATNATYHTSQIVWVPMTINTGFYRMRLKQLSMYGTPITTSLGGGSIVDSGTTYTYMSTKAYKALRGAIEDYCNNHDGCSATRKGNCFHVSATVGLKKFPNITWDLENAHVVWEARSYLYRAGSTTTWCYAFQDDGPSVRTTLGATWMLHKDIIFDLRGSRLGIAEASCPEFKVRPEHKVSAHTGLRPARAPGSREVTTTQRVPTDPSGITELDTGDSSENETRIHSKYVNVLGYVFLAVLTVLGYWFYRRGRKHAIDSERELKVVNGAAISPDVVGDMTYVGPPSYVIADEDDENDDDQAVWPFTGDAEPGRGEFPSARPGAE